MEREVLKLALEALELLSQQPTDSALDYADNAINAIKEALAQPAPVQEFGLTRERFNALEAEITTLQSDWLFALKEVVRLKAAQPEQELTLQEQLDKARADWDKAQVDWRKADADLDKAYADRRKAKAALERIEKLMDKPND